MWERIGRIHLPPWVPWAVGGALVSFFGLVAFVVPASIDLPRISVAFIGNSMMYYNDFPRFMEALSGSAITQNSCLHGDASLWSILRWGSGTYKIWKTGAARIFDSNARIYDFGACTVPQLLFGYDMDLETKVQGGDDGEGDDFFSYDDGSNPCTNDDYYLAYLDNVYWNEGAPKYDFVVMNDNTRSPARSNTRAEGLKVLKSTYAPWLEETGAIPVFLFTYGYSKLAQRPCLRCFL